MLKVIEMERMKLHNYLFAAGGTGGHIFPALSIANEIKKIDTNAQLLFVGTSKRMESKLIPHYGYDFKTIWISGLTRKLDLKNLLFPIKLIVSLIQSFIIIKNFKPSVVIGTGGYVCAPVLLIASLLNVKTVLHESNSYPGLVTRLLAPKVDMVFISFDVTRKWLRSENNLEKVGVPIRNVLTGISKTSGLEFFGFKENKKTILITGGSLGSVSINKAVLKSLELFLKSNIQVIWQVGEKDFDNIKNVILSLDSELKEAVWISKFIDRMEYAYAAADVVICRAGATTIAEITALGKPAILVPYPYATSNHQFLNAKTLQDSNAAIIIEDNKLSELLEKVVIELINDETRLQNMSMNCKSLGCSNAAEVIARKIIDILEKDGKNV